MPRRNTGNYSSDRADSRKDQRRSNGNVGKCVEVESGVLRSTSPEKPWVVFCRLF
jgi:hypothetical protein